MKGTEKYYVLARSEPFFVTKVMFDVKEAKTAFVEIYDEDEKAFKPVKRVGYIYFFIKLEIYLFFT